ncbi:ABATE domain-containing protein [Streptomyces sp. NPDC087270]|uniref:ABATE domain-containing protein n=1 Tax=Streptomyces sp. NPDC087270 TaxID=3365774 RepID=UPI00382448D4
MPVDHLALALAVTVRHDGHGGVADDLAAPEGLTAWVRQHERALAEYGFVTADEGDGRADPAHPAVAADPAVLAAAVGVRTALRALFARAVLPGAPSKADAGRLPDAAAALERLNAAAARVPVTHRLAWPADGPPAAGYAVAGRHAPADLLAAALARAGMAFLAGPDRARLRACPAPRCVRYFVQAHARQEWCKPSCGNRARVARHHARQRARTADDPN